MQSTAPNNTRRRGLLSSRAVAALAVGMLLAKGKPPDSLPVSFLTKNQLSWPVLLAFQNTTCASESELLFPHS